MLVYNTTEQAESQRSAGGRGGPKEAILALHVIF